ncbi:transcriptional repressor LexA [Candidatus Riflebacteria bacterium]
MSLSPRKKQFLQFIVEFSDTNGYPPSYREIQEGFGINSPGTVNWYVRELSASGYLKKTRGFNGKRALMVVKENLPSADAGKRKEGSLPFSGYIAAGKPLHLIEIADYVEVPPGIARRGDYVLKVEGDSMLDANIHDGDFVVIQRCESPAEGQNVVAYLNGAVTLKKFYRKRDKIELRPCNSECESIFVHPEDDFRVLGIVHYSFRYHQGM